MTSGDFLMTTKAKSRREAYELSYYGDTEKND